MTKYEYIFLMLTQAYLILTNIVIMHFVWKEKKLPKKTA